MQVNLVNVSLVTNINKNLKTLTQTLLKSFVQRLHTSVNKFDNTSVDNCNVETLSMKPRKQISTLHKISVSPLIQSAV